jgi:hypothetical protein
MKQIGHEALFPCREDIQNVGGADQGLGSWRSLGVMFPNACRLQAFQLAFNGGCVCFGMAVGVARLSRLT